MGKKHEFIEWSKQGYVSEFLSMRCAGDILNVASPLGPKAEKEVTEAMAVVKQLRSIVLAEPRKYSVIDFCAGNALASLIAVHLLPIRRAMAVDIKPRKRDWHKVQRFDYIEADIRPIKYSNTLMMFANNVLRQQLWEHPLRENILISIHPCCNLALNVIDLYKQTESIRHLVIIPCCVGSAFQTEGYCSLLAAKLSKYERWAWWLAQRVKGDVGLDKKCYSPCNAVVVAHK